MNRGEKMKRVSYILFSMFLVLVSCNQGNDHNHGEELFPLEVEIEILPETLVANEPITFNAHVTYGDEKVEDANEVQFQIWEKGNEEGEEFFEGEHVGEGTYSIQKTFDHDGIYYVVAHVTARNMHNMPKKEFIIGEAEDSSSEETEGHHEGEESEHEEHSSSHHNHSHGHLTVDLELPAEVTKNNETKLRVSVTDHEVPLTEANVVFELWKEGQTKHEFIRTSEVSEGVYESSFVFQEDGTYEVRIHVEKESLHEHIEKTLEVK